MEAGIADLVIEAGADFDDALQLLKESDGLPLITDWTGYTASMDIRAVGDISPTAPATPILQLTTANGRIVLSGSTGLVQFAVPAAVTTTLAPTVGGREHVYDLELVAPGGARYRYVKGTVRVLAEVTR